MLKSKKSMYILLPVVVFIWGTIIYKIVDAFSGDDSTVVAQTKVALAEIKPVKRDTFTIHPVTRDPFLGKVYHPKPKHTATKILKPKRVTISWPSITYKGVVSGKGKSKANTIYLISINGVDQLLQPKETSAEGVRLVWGTSTAIQVQYKGNAKRFEISN